MTPEQAALDAAQAAYEAAHARWEQASIARRAAEAEARSHPTLVVNGRLVEHQYTPAVAARLRRLREIEDAAWAVRVEAGDAVPLARQAAAAADARARHAALFGG